jgi:hypothetical protein
MPVIAYSDGTANALKMPRCTSISCAATTRGTIGTPISATYAHTSLSFGNDGFPVIAYGDRTSNEVRVVKCGNATCSMGNVNTTVSAFSGDGDTPSITIGADGLPFIAWHRDSSQFAKCRDVACASSFVDSVNLSTFSAGQAVSVTTGADGMPVWAYMASADGTSFDVRVVRCSNPFCMNNWVRR